MQDVLLKRITELEQELAELYEEFEHSDSTYYAKHATLSNNILKKSEELMNLKNFIQDEATA